MTMFGDGFVGSSKSPLLSGGYIYALDVRLVYGVLADGDGAVFEIVGLGEYP